MISFDTNILLYSFLEDSEHYDKANAWMQSIYNNEKVVFSEYVAIEFYCLIRNPIVLKKPLSALDAVDVITQYRENPFWKIAGSAKNSRQFYDLLWTTAQTKQFPYKSIYDARLALSLIQHGVKEFATSNLKHFERFHFENLFNPLNKIECRASSSHTKCTKF